MAVLLRRRWPSLILARWTRRWCLLTAVSWRWRILGHNHATCLSDGGRSGWLRSRVSGFVLVSATCISRKTSLMLTHVVGVAFEVRWVAYRPRLVAWIGFLLNFGDWRSKERMQKASVRRQWKLVHRHQVLSSWSAFSLLVACCRMV